MERVRAFMAPLALTEAGAAAGYDLMVEFRANTGAELEGNKIIDWTVSVGGQIQRWREPPKPLRWEPGQPVLVSLRLARDGPVLPRADPTQPALSVEDRTVNFRFSDPWALYSLIGGQREPDTAGRPETRAQLLRFEFPLVPLVPVAADAGSAQPEAPKARVFLRLTVSPAGKRTPLVWPLTFPTRAPEWGAP
jgi:type VI secretion system protein ImpL